MSKFVSVLRFAPWAGRAWWWLGSAVALALGVAEPSSAQAVSVGTSSAAGSQPTPAQLAPIEVSATPDDADVRLEQRLTPGAVHVVDGDSLFQRPVSNLSGALRYVPGVMAESNTGGDDQVLSIRGSNLSALSYDNGGVALFQDGLPVSAADGNNHNRLIDPLGASEFIVANGANALTYGASELGGAIDAISRTARNSDPTQIYLSAGGHGLFNGQLSVGGVADSLDGLLTLENKHFDGYRQHSGLERTGVSGNVGLRVSDRLRLRLFASHVDSRQKLAGALTRSEFEQDPRQADPSAALGDHAVDVKTDRVALKGDWDIDARSRLEFGLSYEVQHLYHPIVDVFNFATTPPAHYFSLLVDTRQQTVGGMLRYHLRADNHELLAGLSLAQTSNKGGNYANDGGQRGTRMTAIDQQSDNATLTLMDRWHIAPRWTLVYGAQGVATSRDSRSTTLSSGDQRRQDATYSAVNPRLGLIYALNRDSALFANVSRVYQAPNNYDLDNDVRQDDAVLRAMHGVSYEIGTRGQGALPFAAATGRWSLSLYHADIRNEILSVDNPAKPGSMLATNYGKTVHEGIEALGSASFPLAGTPHRIEPLVSATYQRFRFKDDPAFGNNRLPSAPSYIVHGEVMYRHQTTGFYAGPTFDLVGSRYADMANTYRVGAYQLLGLRAGVERDRWDLYAELSNLTDKKYVSAVTVLTQADADARVLNPGAPRSIFVGGRFRY
ncbi:TonB-dependent receptor [Castellaniella caeni]